MSDAPTTQPKKRGRPRKTVAPLVTMTDSLQPDSPASAPPKPEDVLSSAIDRLAEQMAVLLAKRDGREIDPADIAKQVSHASRVVQYPQNPDPPEVSAFSHQNGDVWAKAHIPGYKKFHRKIWFNGAPEDPERLSHPEIEAWNRLSHALQSPGSELVTREGHWRASVRPNNREIDVVVPAKAFEQSSNIPNGLAFIVQEFLDGTPADPLVILEQANRVRDMEKQVAELRAIIQNAGLAARPSAGPITLAG